MSAPEPIKTFTLAILECDQPLDTTRQVRGGHTGVWQDAFDDTLSRLSIPTEALNLRRYNAEEALPDLENDGIDGILISGSRYNAWDTETPWINRLVEFTKKCLDSNLRVIGICFGHQIVGRALGSEISRNEAGWEIGPTKLELTEKGKEIFGTEEVTIHLMNRDVVKTCPPGVEVLASSPSAKIHSMYKPDSLFTVQGHPEFDATITNEIVELRKLKEDPGWEETPATIKLKKMILGYEPEKSSESLETITRYLIRSEKNFFGEFRRG